MTDAELLEVREAVAEAARPLTLWALVALFLERDGRPYGPGRAQYRGTPTPIGRPIGRPGSRFGPGA